MTLARIKRNYQITIPSSLRRQYNISVGDYMEIEKKQGGLIIKPVKIVHSDQEYFYTKEWQEGEAQADKDIANGDMLGPFDTAEDCIKALKKAKI